jgi:hypothetical protein
MAVATDLESDLAQALPATFTKKGLTEDEYFALCAKFDNAFVEYTADGTVIPLRDLFCAVTAFSSTEPSCVLPLQ